MNAWQPISTAPKDGTRIVCWREGWEFPVILMWKHSYRIEEAHKNLHSSRVHDPDYWRKCSQDYFGLPEEMDDYDLATAEGAPTHWKPIFPLPVPQA